MQKINVLEPLLKNGRVAIIDGAFGTEIESRGFDISSQIDLWSAKVLDLSPDLAIQVHKDYLLSGADIIITASYKASLDVFISRGYSEEKSVSLIKSSVHLAKKARDEVWKEI